MVIGLVFIYLAIFLYVALLAPVAGLAIYASFRFQRRTAYALWGLLGWLLAAPGLTVVLIVALDWIGLAPDPMHDEELRGFWIPVRVGYLGCLPLFLVPLGIRLFGARQKKPLPS